MQVTIIYHKFYIHQCLNSAIRFIWTHFWYPQQASLWSLWRSPLMNQIPELVRSQYWSSHDSGSQLLFTYRINISENNWSGILGRGADNEWISELMELNLILYEISDTSAIYFLVIQFTNYSVYFLACTQNIHVLFLKVSLDMAVSILKYWCKLISSTFLYRGQK